MLLTAWLTACWWCGGAPDWPENGAVDAQWVEQAIEWRLSTGVDECGETAKAVDALTMAWIADSESIVVRIQTADWPFLKYYEELKTPLIQALALGQMQSEIADRQAVIRTMRKVVRRSNALRYRRVKEYLKP